MTRRHILSAVLASPLAVGAAEAATVIAPAIPVASPIPWGLSSVIQRFLAPGQPLDEPEQAKDPSLELVWQKVIDHAEHGSLHQRLYVPKAWGTPQLPEDFLDGRGFQFSKADLAERKHLTTEPVVWRDIQP